MNDSKISVRYARALFQSALEKKVLDNVFRDMETIGEVCTVPEMKELLTSPIIPPSKKKEILRKVFGSNLEKITASLIDIVVTNGRESYIPAIARVLIKEIKEYKGVTESVLTTAVKIKPEVKKRISDLIEGIYSTKVDMKEVVDPGIIGGFILKIEDNYIDASVRNKLRKIEKELKGNSLTT